jgi:hypothetical protein
MGSITETVGQHGVSAVVNLLHRAAAETQRMREVTLLLPSCGFGAASLKSIVL